MKVVSARDMESASSFDLGSWIGLRERSMGMWTSHFPFSRIRHTTLLDVLRGVVFVYRAKVVSFFNMMLSMTIVAGIFDLM